MTINKRLHDNKKLLEILTNLVQLHDNQSFSRILENFGFVSFTLDYDNEPEVVLERVVNKLIKLNKEIV